MFLGVLERAKMSLQDMCVPFFVKLKTAPARLIFQKIKLFLACTFQPDFYRPQNYTYFFKKIKLVIFNINVNRISFLKSMNMAWFVYACSLTKCHKKVVTNLATSILCEHGGTL